MPSRRDQGAASSKVLPRAMRARLSLLLLTAASTLHWSSAWSASEENLRGVPVQNLPRPGYETKDITIGEFTLSPQIELDGAYNSNIFARQIGAVGDEFLSISPKMVVRKSSSDLNLSADVFADLYRYIDHPRENVDTYGFDVSGNYKINQASSASISGGYQRVYQHREDVEPTSPGLPPALIDEWTGDVGYTFRPGRIGFVSSAGFTKINYLDPINADRNYTSYRAKLRGLYALTHHVDLFVDAYFNDRDFRLPVDFTGVNRDAITYGTNVGVAVDISDLWSGEMGIGAFQSDPRDPTLRSFSGLSANGSITWHPRPRTALTLDVFQGDRATVQSGAYGRTDSTIVLSIEEEARHNLLLDASIGRRVSTFRGTTLQKTTITPEFGAEYLLNRRASITLQVYRSDRTTSTGTNQFLQYQVEIGTRLRF